MLEEQKKENLIKIENYLQNKKHGEFRNYDIDGNLKAIVIWSNGKSIGPKTADN